VVALLGDVLVDQRCSWRGMAQARYVVREIFATIRNSPVAAQKLPAVA
jgi:hypothetical protein